MIPVILISGWAMPGTVLHPIAVSLEKLGHEVTVLTLPGFGHHEKEILTWEQLESWAITKIPENQPVILSGWSMGANLATLVAAKLPKLTAGLVTLASNPCFVQNKNWPTAMSEKKFNYFKETAEHNIQRCLKHFTNLCTQGSPESENQKNYINKALAQQPFYASSLILWLKWLETSDHRSYLRKVQSPVRHIFASEDALVPIAIAKQIKYEFSWHDVQIKQTSHSFFLDEPSDVAAQISSVTAMQ